METPDKGSPDSANGDYPLLPTNPGQHEVNVPTAWSSLEDGKFN